MAGAVVDRRQFFISYLFAWLFWLGLALGCFSVTMIHHLTGGRWGYPVRRFLEAGFSTLPLMAVLGVPILFGLQLLFPWARIQEAVRDPVLLQKQSYLNPVAFSARALICFAVW